MNAAFIAIVVLVLYYLGYRYYSKFLSEKIFRLADEETTPAHELEDSVDYVPTNKHVLFGHHFRRSRAPHRSLDPLSPYSGVGCQP